MPINRHVSTANNAITAEVYVSDYVYILPVWNGHNTVNGVIELLWACDYSYAVNIAPERVSYKSLAHGSGKLKLSFFNCASPLEIIK